MHRVFIPGTLFLAIALLMSNNLGAQPDKKDAPQNKAQEALDKIGKELEEEAKKVKDVGQLGPKYAPKFLAHAKAHAGDPSASMALLLVLRMTMPREKGPRAEALKIFRKDYLATPLVKSQMTELAEDPLDLDALDLLREIAKDHPNKSVQALACKSLITSQKMGLEAIAKIKGSEKLRKQLSQALSEETLTEILESAPGFQKNIKACHERLVGDLKGLVSYVAVGAPAPLLEAEDLGGKKVKLSDIKDKVVVVDFWATWCPPCRAMIPHTTKTVAKMKDRPFVFISVSADDTAEAVTKFQEKTKMPWPNWWVGNNGKTLEAWDVDAFPSIFVVDHKGTIRYSQKGADDEVLDAEVEKIVKEAEADLAKEKKK